MQPHPRPTEAIRRKLDRLTRGGKPRVLDVFAGCGGLSLGFLAAGFEITAAIESDQHAAASHGANFHASKPVHQVARDIRSTDPGTLTRELGLGAPAESFDVLVGGPPCQAFARVGRSKLRELADHPEAYRHDPRSRLYLDYINYVRACAPLAVVLENVPDMLNFGAHDIAQEFCEVLSSLGYVGGYTLLNAARYGVPQMRERVFLIGLRAELANHVEFPLPTHSIDLPSGYDGSRAVALKHLKNNSLYSTGFWVPIPVDEEAADLTPAVSAEEALKDLPTIDARAELAAGRLRRGARRFDFGIPYPTDAGVTEYSRLMRSWPGFEAPRTITDHVIRYLPRDYALFSRMNPGDQYPEAYRHAEEMFEEELMRRSNSPWQKCVSLSRRISWCGDERLGQ